MEYIRGMSNEDIKMELSRFKGVGPKTVSVLHPLALEANH